MSRAQNLGSISTRRQRIAKLAEKDRSRSLHSLSHYIDEYWLREAFSQTRRDSAPGVDGQTWVDYEKNAGANLRDLLDRFKSGCYRASPVRRHYLPKEGDPKSVRPIGISTVEDKILQRAVAMVLEPIYEQEFEDFSYGYRPGRGAHAALVDLWEGVMELKGGWVLEVDIRNFFEELDHQHLRSFLDRRVRDGVIRRTIDKWLKAGVQEEGKLSYPKSGTPQGGVISPWLANIYLHEVIDRWYVEEVRPRMYGKTRLYRYADDMVFVFANKRDAYRVQKVLPLRLGKYGLRLNPEKTRLVDFRKPAKTSGSSRPTPRRRSFDFLGFTHYWGWSRKRTRIVKRKTSTRRMSRGLKSIRQWCRRYRHAPLSWQREQLAQKLEGHYQYYGMTGNWRALDMFYQEVRRIWRTWLDRRSQKAKMKWEKFLRLLERHSLPRPKIKYRVSAR